MAACVDSIEDSPVSVSLDQLIRLNQAAGKLALHQNAVQAMQSGNYLSQFKGRGMEFDETRLYMPGDDIRMMDWRVTARTGEAHTKLYREERERPVLIAVDYRSSMFFATRGVFKSVLAARLAALLSWSAQRHGDRIGGQIFTDTACREFKPQTGRQAVLHWLKQLADASQSDQRNTTPMTESESAPLSQLQKALGRLCQHARPGSQILILSDFRGLTHAAEHHLMRLCRHCDVGLMFLYDDLERTLPKAGYYRLSDRVNETVINTTDTRLVAHYQQRFQQRHDQLRTLALKYRMGWIACSTTDDPVHLLTAAGLSPQRQPG